MKKILKIRKVITGVEIRNFYELIRHEELNFYTMENVGSFVSNYVPIDA